MKTITVKDVIGTNAKANTGNKYVIRATKFDKVEGFLSANIHRRSTDPKDFNRNYQIFIKWTPIDNRFTVDSDVQVQCSCTDFTIRWKYVLSQNNGLYDGNNPLTLNDQARGIPPVEKNPSQKMGVCKHLSFSLDALLKN